jgi:hypothetical protein
MTTYHARGEWTSTKASGEALPGTLLRGVAVHWPGTTQDRIGTDKAAIASRLRHYRDYHVNSKGWRDIGYNIAIDQAGRVWMLRSTAWKGNMIGAHCASPANRDANREYVGVLFLLGDEEPMSSAMLAAFRDWYRNRFLPAYAGRTDVRPHGEVPGASTACAGPYVKARITDLRTVPAPKPVAYKPPAFPKGIGPNKSTPCAITLQKALKKKGYMPSWVVVNCNYGPQTQKAVARFHNANTRFRSIGVTWDTRIGPLGWNHLFMEAYGGAR